LIFFSASDFRIVESGQMSFVSALRRKLRYAAEEGQPYLPLAADESTPGKRAIAAAITEPWPNGQTEGQITKLKMIKRQMYGRANLDLLRARLCPS
jgi:transposase